MFRIRSAHVQGALLVSLLSSVAPLQAFAADVSIGKGVTNTSAKTVQGQDKVTVEQGGTLDVSGAAITWNGSSPSPGVTITNSGTIKSDTGRAIDTHGNTGPFFITITNNAGAVIDASNDTIRINTADATVNLVNGGTIVSHGGQALDFGAVTAADASISVHNLVGGVISADADDAIHADGGTFSLVNEGTISSVLSESRGIDIGAYVDVGSVLIDNRAGATIESMDDTIRVDGDEPAGDANAATASGKVVVNNAGLIVSRNDGQAIDFDHIYSTNSNVTINNFATGEIRAENADAIRPGEGGVVNNYGKIVSNAPRNTSGDPNDDTSNDGVDFQGHKGTVNNYAGGTISGSRHGITSDVGVTVTNYGTITGRNGSGVGSDGVGTVTNYGTITGTIDDNSVNGDGDGVDIDGIATITNYGTIQGTGAKGEKDGSINTSEGVSVGGGTIDNLSSTSVISGATNGILVDDSNGGNAPGATEITNRGTIRGGAGFGIKLIGNQNDTITNSGLIEGTNGLAIDMGAGDDTLNIQTGSRIIGTVDGGAGTDTITLNGTGAGTFAGAQNFEFLDLQSGSWTLTGSQSYSGGVTLGAGTLSVDGTLDATLDVAAGSTLNGNGTLGSVSVAGTIAPGHSIGKLTFTGTYTQLAGSDYLVEANEAGNSDFVDVIGTATLAGSVTAKAFPLFLPNNRYTILTAGGGITGTYDQLNSDPHAYLNFALNYDANDVYLDVNRNAVAFADLAKTKNQSHTATAVESLGAGNTAYDVVANVADADAADTAFDALSGEIHASARTALIEDSHFIRDAVANRLRAAFGAISVPGAVQTPGSNHDVAMWGQAFGSWGSNDGNGNAADLDRNIGGFLVGGDAALDDHWRVGALTGYSRSTFDVDSRASSGHSDDYHLGIYGGGQWGALGFSTGAAYTWHDLDTHRAVRIPNFTDSLTADYDADTAQLFGEVNYDVKTAQVDLQPFANLAYVNLHSDRFSEKGGAAALSGASSDDNLTFTTLGLRASKDVSLGSTPATVRGAIGWRHALGDVGSSSSLAFAGGDAFSVSGVPVARDMLTLDAGIDVNLSAKASLGVSYSGQIAGKSSTNGVKANLAVKF